MLFYCHGFGSNGMKVAKYDPTVSTADFQPSVILHVLWEIVGFAVMPFNAEWRLHMSKCFGEALAKIAVKVKG